MNENNILAWCGTKTKSATLAEFQAHIDADELIAGTYGDEFGGKWKGCAVGCLTGGSNHELYPELYGIPVQLAYLHDAIFEGLSKSNAKAGQQWSYRFLEVIEEGANLSRVFSQIIIALFEDEKHGILKLYPDNQHKTGLVQVIDLHKRIIAGGSVTIDEWRAAARAAADAAAYAADAAADATPYAAARAAAAGAAAAADAEAYAAARAAAAGAAAAADAGARADFWQWLSDEILILLAAAPIGELIIV